ncbi:MAG: hypothetical protein IKV02_01155, partial [Clostridia bacterium]|nr:hypothetical protein [Clostridia bacterium]
MKHRHSIVIVVSFVLLLCAFSLAFWLIPDREFSPRENRALQTLPRIDAQTLLSGELSRTFNDYFADQFPARDLLVSLKGGLELLAAKGENNGILLGSDGQLAKRLFALSRTDDESAKDSDVIDAEHLKNAAEGINRAAENVDVPLAVFLTGRTFDVAASAFLYPGGASDQMLQILRETVNDDVKYLDLVP